MDLSFALPHITVIHLETASPAPCRTFSRICGTSLLRRQQTLWQAVQRSIEKFSVGDQKWLAQVTLPDLSIGNQMYKFENGSDGLSGRFKLFLDR